LEVKEEGTSEFQLEEEVPSLFPYRWAAKTTPAPVLVTEEAGSPARLAHQCRPPMRQILVAPWDLTAFKRACMPGVLKEAPCKVPPFNQMP
jgi:hypothetical protein